MQVSGAGAIGGMSGGMGAMTGAAGASSAATASAQTGQLEGSANAGQNSVQASQSGMLESSSSLKNLETGSLDFSIMQQLTNNVQDLNSVQILMLILLMMAGGGNDDEEKNGGGAAMGFLAGLAASGSMGQNQFNFQFEQNFQINAVGSSQGLGGQIDVTA